MAIKKKVTSKEKQAPARLAAQPAAIQVRDWPNLEILAEGPLAKSKKDGRVWNCFRRY